MKRVAQAIDITAWDNWLPLSVIAVFVTAAVLVVLGVVDVGISDTSANRLSVLFTDIGIQTTAGIFAIIISLSLVAIQFAAQEYSHRIMEYYIKSVIFWSTIVVYLGVIVSGILLQARLTETGDLRVAGVMVVASILTLALLVPHFVVTASYLKPEFIIQKLLRRVDESYLRSLANKIPTGGPVIDPSSDRLLPVVEITERSIDRGDLTTTRGSLRRLLETYQQHHTESPSAAADRYFLDHLLRIGRKAVTHSDEDEAAVYTIEIMGLIGRSGPSALAADYIDVLAFIAVKRESEVVLRQVIDSLRLVFIPSEPVTRQTILTTYRDMIGQLAGTGHSRLLHHLIAQTAEIAAELDATAEQDEADACLDLLEAVGIQAASCGLMPVVRRAGQSLAALGAASAPRSPATGSETVTRILRIERAVDRRERETIAALEFARVEVERATPSRPPEAVQRESQAESHESAVSGFEELWDEPDK